MAKKIFLICLSLLFFALPVAYSAKAPIISVNEKMGYINMSFFEKFDDEYLLQYIKKAVENNHSARSASYSVEEYRNNVKMELGREFPSLSVGANYVGIKIPNVGDYDLQKNGFVLPLVANWELDLLLKNWDRVKSAKKTYFANKETEKAIYIALASDVATVYFNIMKLDKEIELQEIALKNQKDIFDRTNAQFSAGVISKGELNEATKKYEKAKSDLISLKSSRDVALSRLAILIGESPSNINDFKRTKFDNFKGKINIPKSIKSETIFARPDVLAAEAKLEAAKINVRIARKELLPSFNITGIWAFNTIAPGGFFSWQSSLAYLLAGATQDLFMGGRKIANIKIMRARYEKMFEEYKQTDLIALKEVNDSLLYLKNDNEILKNANTQLDVEKNNFELSKRKLDAGTISKIKHLNDENNYLKMKQYQTDVKVINFMDYITLYKAVGGNL